MLADHLLVPLVSLLLQEFKSALEHGHLRNQLVSAALISWSVQAHLVAVELVQPLLLRLYLLHSLLHLCLFCLRILQLALQLTDLSIEELDIVVFFPDDALEFPSELSDLAGRVYWSDLKLLVELALVPNQNGVDQFVHVNEVFGPFDFCGILLLAAQELLDCLDFIEAKQALEGLVDLRDA